MCAHHPHHQGMSIFTPQVLSFKGVKEIRVEINMTSQSMYWKLSKNTPKISWARQVISAIGTMRIHSSSKSQQKQIQRVQFSLVQCLLYCYILNDFQT